MRSPMAAGRLPTVCKQLVNQTKKLGSGLNEASSFLLGMKHDAEKPSMAGFNIPPQVLTADEFKKAAQIFVSPDGHAARYFVQSALQSVHHRRHGSGECDHRGRTVGSTEYRVVGRLDIVGRNSDWASRHPRLLQR